MIDLKPQDQHIGSGLLSARIRRTTSSLPSAVGSSVRAHEDILLRIGELDEAIEHLAAYGLFPQDMVITGGEEPEVLSGAAVSPNFFRTFAVDAVIGRADHESIRRFRETTGITDVELEPLGLEEIFVALCERNRRNNLHEQRRQENSFHQTAQLRVAAMGQ